jgi:hypothetical protein
VGGATVVVVTSAELLDWKAASLCSASAPGLVLLKLSFAISLSILWVISLPLTVILATTFAMLLPVLWVVAIPLAKPRAPF